MSFKHLSAFLFTFFFLSATANQAFGAAVVNGGFESGDMSGWAGVGDFSAADANIGDIPRDAFGNAYDPAGNPVSSGSTSFIGTGNYVGLLTTGISLGSPDPVSTSVMESFLGLFPGSLSALAAPGTPGDGSAIKQELTVQAGDTFEFDFYFLTNRAPNSLTKNDFAFMALDGIAVKLADTDSTPLFKATLLELGTGFYHNSILFLGSGTYTFGLGVLAVGGGDTSALLIDNFSFSGPSTPLIPEPSAFLLMTAALILAVFFGQMKGMKL